MCRIKRSYQRRGNRNHEEVQELRRMVRERDLEIEAWQSAGKTALALLVGYRNRLRREYVDPLYKTNLDSAIHELKELHPEWQTALDGGGGHDD